MADIVLAAFNARYAHSSFGARYLLADLGELQEQAELMEFDLQEQPRVAAEKILARHPRIVGIGCYIWNIDLATKVAALLKLLRPDIRLILGGPEISHETEAQEIARYADHVICGEGEIEFPKLCSSLLTVPQASRLPGSTGFSPFVPAAQTLRKNLPHWTQDGCTYFVTFRLADSIAQTRIKEYEELRRKWEEHHQPPYTDKERERFNELFSERVDEWLDQGAGSCCLRDPAVSQIVADTLGHFDGERYDLDEWVVMPNHVHVLVRPLGDYKLPDILHSWKSYSAHEIYKAMREKGIVWQRESYDHIVRNVDELLRIRNYIRSNPEKAGIRAHHAGSRRDACDTEATVPQASRLPRIIKAEPVDVAEIELPYDLYTDEDIAHRAIYVEASRGCPFRCEYCMSSLDPCVRFFPEDRFLSAMQRLLDRGARAFKFVDRTFNIDIPFALRILDFFRARHEPGMMLHFEVIPSHLPDELMEAVATCPPGMLQFEVGIQTFNEDVARRIQRPLDIAKIEANMRRLREETGVHIHSDLIAGLPGEDLESFEFGFNRLLALNPQEIQLGILKRLRGAPIDRHSKDWNMVYSPHAPYEILQTSLIPFEQMQRVQRFARYWNLIVNNGQFINTAPLIWQGCQNDSGTTVPPGSLSQAPEWLRASGLPSPFAAFMEFSDWLYAQTNTTGNLHMVRLAQLLFDFLTLEKHQDSKTVADEIWKDYQRGNRPDVPGFLKKFGVEYARQEDGNTTAPQATHLPRQQRHNPNP